MITKRNHKTALNSTIVALKAQQAKEFTELKATFLGVYENLRPINVIKNTVQDLVSANNLKHNLVPTIIAITTGFLARKVVVGKSQNPVKQIAGTLLQFVLTNFISNKSRNHSEEEETEVKTAIT